METEKDDAELYLLNVQDCVHELIVNFSEKDEVAASISEKGIHNIIKSTKTGVNKRKC